MPAVGGEKYLLFVDDEPTLVVLIRMTLKHRGISVLTAASGEEALGLVEQDSAHAIKAIFTDINMGKMTGWELIERCRELRTDLQYMVLTAEADNAAQGARMVQDGELLAYFDKISADRQEMFAACTRVMIESP